MPSRPHALLAAIVLAAVACGGAPPHPKDISKNGASRLSEPFIFQSPLARSHPLVGSIWARGARIEESELLERAAAATVVWLGEKHDNVDHHRLQSRVIASLADRGACPSVVFEMIEETQQKELEEGERAGRSEVVAEKVAWEKSGWPAFATYAPIFDVALARHLPLVAGNVPKKTVRGIAFEGKESLESSEMNRLGLALPFSDAQTDGLLDELVANHCGHLDKKSAGPLVLAQRARDGALAAHALDSVAHANASCRGPKAVVISGNGHARIDRGGPFVVSARKTDTSQFSIAFVEAEDGKLTLDRYEVAPLYDAVWFTPRANDDDPCAKMKALPKMHSAPPG